MGYLQPDYFIPTLQLERRVLLVENLPGESPARGRAGAVITITGNKTEGRISGSPRARGRETETRKLTITTLPLGSGYSPSNSWSVLNRSRGRAFVNISAKLISV